jgi:hypothetical protein
VRLALGARDAGEGLIGLFTVGAYPVKYAKEWVRSVHRRLPDMTGAMWCIGLWLDDEMRGLAVVGRPCARRLDAEKRARIATLEVIRVAVVEGTPNGCSILYGASSRAGRAMGLDGLLTYIHNDENGASLKAANWIEDGFTDGGQWDRDGRQRQLVVDHNPKRRWWAPWSKAIEEPSHASPLRPDAMSALPGRA